jgi:glucose/arabinose dehydrogenase
MRKGLLITISVLVIGAVAAVEIHFALAFANHELASVYAANRPTITFTRPADHELNVLPNTYISCDINLPNTGAGVSAGSLFNGALKLYRTADKKPVPMHFNTSGGGDSIVATPDDLLDASTEYSFEVTDGVKDTSGARFVPYTLEFTTASGAATSDYPVAFDKIAMEDTKVMSPDGKHPSAYTGLTMGPDNKLYAATFDGRILRFDIAADGRLKNREAIMTMFGPNRGPRLITGIVFDPTSTADNLILWVSHGQMALEDATDWTGKISVLRGPKLEHYQDIVTGLPRAYRDHLNFQPSFGPDGALYFCQGSMTSVGGPDKKWNLRHEHLLTAACLRLDPKLISNPPLNVKTEDGGTYNPSAPDAPLTIFSTGIRSGFQLLWHSNGVLYTGLNGAAAGGNVLIGPHSPAIHNIKETTEDLLLKLVKGGYYGHPNEKRHEYVLMGGNPTDHLDPQEITEYPVGTMPEKEFQLPAYDFGKSVSPNGLCEYHGGPLDGKILVTRYSGGKDIIVLTPGKDGNITEALTGIDGFNQFGDPLDIVEDVRSGNLYVAEYGGKQLTLLIPKPGAVSKRVFRQTVLSQP